MSRKNGFYRVTHGGETQIMSWTSLNNDNTEPISGYWNGDNSYTGNDHDMSFINEKLITEKELLKILNRPPNEND